MARWSRRSSGRSPTSADVLRARIGLSAIGSSGLSYDPPIAHDPVDLDPFVSGEVLGRYVSRLRRVAEVRYTPPPYIPFPYRHRPKGDFGSPVRMLAERVQRVRSPKKVMFCVVRKQRRQVLFALRRAGYSGSVKKRFYRRDYSSQWRC